MHAYRTTSAMVGRRNGEAGPGVVRTGGIDGQSCPQYTYTKSKLFYLFSRCLPHQIDALRTLRGTEDGAVPSVRALATSSDPSAP